MLIPSILERDPDFWRRETTIMTWRRISTADTWMPCVGLIHLRLNRNPGK
jgi:hypothetical protein